MKIGEAQALLARARLLEARAQALEAEAARRAPAADAATPGAAPSQTGAFADLMERSVNSVNETMAGAEAKTGAFLRNDPDANLVETMVAVNKAQVSFRTMVEIRNHLIQAYKDIASMPV